MEYIYGKLTDYGRMDYYGFHMPGHKRNKRITGAALPYEIDITEIDGFDDLHHSDGLLKDAQERAAVLFHSQETHYLINGSTAGILSAVLGCTRRGGRVLIARNCHKSVYNAVYLNELQPVYLYPEQDPRTGLSSGIRASDVRRILDQCERESEPVQAVVIVSPTYDGVVSDVEAIAKEVHKSGIPLIVDEAHGAHFGFHEYFPKNANEMGADVVIHSVHKTLPSLTQTALLHMNGELVDRERVRMYLHMLQTSSPSYVLMASIDECVRVIEERGRELFDGYVGRLERTRNAIQGLSSLRLLETESYDRSKLVVSVETAQTKDGASVSGRDLYRILLEEYHLQMEMAAGNYVVAMTGPGDTEEGMDRLVVALLRIDGSLCVARRGTERFHLPRLRQACSPAQAGQCGGSCVKRVPWREAIDKMALEYAYLYPPGIPLIVPGEIVSEEAARLLEKYEALGFSVEGNARKGTIKVSCGQGKEKS